MKTFSSTAYKTAKKTATRSLEEFQMLDKQLNCQTYIPLPVVIAKGKGVEAWDIEGRRY